MNDKVNVRMCFVCKCYKPKPELVRITVKGNTPLADKDGKAGGRGAYICSRACLEKAIKTKRINSILKMNADQEFLDMLKEELK